VLLFPSGYQTNLGVLGALAGPGDLVLCDHHAASSMLPAPRARRPSTASDVSSAEKRLLALAPTPARSFHRVALGMDGDIAPLAAGGLAENTARPWWSTRHTQLACWGGRGLCHEAGVSQTSSSDPGQGIRRCWRLAPARDAPQYLVNPAGRSSSPRSTPPLPPPSLPVHHCWKRSQERREALADRVLQSEAASPTRFPRFRSPLCRSSWVQIVRLWTPLASLRASGSSCSQSPPTLADNVSASHHPKR